MKSRIHIYPVLLPSGADAEGGSMKPLSERLKSVWVSLVTWVDTCAEGPSDRQGVSCRPFDVQWSCEGPNEAGVLCWFHPFNASARQRVAPAVQGSVSGTFAPHRRHLRRVRLCGLIDRREAVGRPGKVDPKRTFILANACRG